MTGEPRTVIFDFGGVLVDGSHFRSPPALRDELTAPGVLP